MKPYFSSIFLGSSFQSYLCPLGLPNPNPASSHTATLAGFTHSTQVALVSLQSLPPSSFPVSIAPSNGSACQGANSQSTLRCHYHPPLNRRALSHPPPHPSISPSQGGASHPVPLRYLPSHFLSLAQGQAHRPYHYTNTSSFPQYWFSHNR